MGDVVSDLAPSEVMSAIRATREYRAAALGVPPEAREQYALALARAACSVLIPTYTAAMAEMGQRAASWKQACERAEADRASAQWGRDRALATARALRGVAHAAQDVMTTSATDWGALAAEAWLYGVVIGWECDDTDDDGDVLCRDPGTGRHTCDGALRAVAERFGWDDQMVADLRGYRGTIRGILR